MWTKNTFKIRILEEKLIHKIGLYLIHILLSVLIIRTERGVVSKMQFILIQIVYKWEI